MTIDQWYVNAANILQQASIPSPSLDAHVLLAYILNRDKTWLIAHNTHTLTASEQRRLNILLAKRVRRVPIAYLVGHKEFYGRSFHVTPETLIPRPETEDLVELVIDHISTTLADQPIRLLDAGTGSGCIGITIACVANIELTLSDISHAALSVARKNAKQLGVTPFQCVQSDLLEYWLTRQTSKLFHGIVANLPYVDPSWSDTSPELAYEPPQALYAQDTGLELIKRLIDQATSVLVSGGFLALEADPTQHDAIRHYAHHFRSRKSQGYGLLLSKH